jgi:hypothetical protein
VNTLLASFGGFLSRFRRSNEYEIEDAYTQMLAIVLRARIEIEADRLWRFLQVVDQFRGRGGGCDEISIWLKSHPEIVLDMFELALQQVDVEATGWLFWHDFRTATLNTIEPFKLAQRAFAMLSPVKEFTEKEAFVYELSLSVALSSAPESAALFDDIFLFANGNTRLTGIRERCCRSEIDDWRHKRAISRSDKDRERDESKTERKQNFEMQKEAIRTGSHVGWLSWIAKVYFARFRDVDEGVLPAQRLQSELGDEYAAIAIEGLISALDRNDLPTAKEVAESHVRALQCQ